MDETQNYSFSIFENVKSNIPACLSIDNQSDFIAYMADLYEAHSPLPSQKTDSLMISPAIYKDGVRRSISGVEYVSQWVALDFDNGTDINQTIDIMAASGVGYIIHTTPSHSAGHHKFRLILFTDRTVKPDEYVALWTGLTVYFEDADPACKDASRIYGAPAMWRYPDGSKPIFKSSEGQVLNADDLIQIGSDVLAEMQKASDVVACKAPIRTYNPDAQSVMFDYDPFSLGDLMSSPFVSQKTIDAYVSCGAGGRHAGLYKFMCSCAAQGVRLNIPVSASDLMSLARQVERLNPRSNREWHKTLNQQANNAIIWASQNIEGLKIDPKYLTLL